MLIRFYSILIISSLSIPMIKNSSNILVPLIILYGDSLIGWIPNCLKFWGEANVNSLLVFIDYMKVLLLISNSVLECWRQPSNPIPEISSKGNVEFLSICLRKSRFGIDFISGFNWFCSFLNPIVAPNLKWFGNPICYFDACVILVYVGFFASRCSEMFPKPMLTLFSF